MRRLVVWIAIAGVGGLLLPATVGAQGSISGLVEDTTGGILPGVTVEADSPVNIEGTITAFTDGSGRFTIVNLRPGEYAVTFTLPGFNTFVRDGLLLIGNAALQVNAQMAVGALEETVTVSGESPVVDVQQVRRQFVATRQMMDVLPAARTFSARALLIPGVRNTGMGEGQYWPAVHGSTWKDAQTMNDGMRANSTVDDGQWQMGWEMNDAATAELTFEAGGAPAEAQVGGVIQNAIPKEGGNTFSGTWFTYYGAEALSSDNAKDPALREIIGEPNRLAYDYDTNPAFGGRFIRDRLWFFTSMRGLDRKTWANDTFFAEVDGECHPVSVDCAYRPDSAYLGEPGSQAYSRSYSMTGLLRLTNQINDRHKWRLGFERVNRQHPLSGASISRPPEAANRILQPTGYHAQARYTASISNRLLLEAGFSVQYNKWRREQFSWNEGRPSTRDVSTGKEGGAFWITGWQPEKSRYFKSSVSYVTGSHNFKAGFEHRWGSIELDQPMYADTRQYFYDGPDNPIGVMVLATPLGRGLGEEGNYKGQIDYDTGLFAQDSWTLGRWTLNLGGRADLFSSSVPPQYAPAGTWVPERTFPRYPGPAWNTIVGRLGVAYDVFGDGRTALKGTVHQYVSSESTRLAMEVNPLSSFTWSAAQEYRSWDDLDGNRSIVGPEGRVQYEEVGASPNVNFGTANDLTDLDLDREGHWEFNAQLQHELVSGVSTSFGWYRRNYYNQWHRANLSQDANSFSPFNVTGPADPRLQQWSAQALTLYNVNPEAFGNVSRGIRTTPLNDRRYDGFEWTLDGRMPNGAFFGGSVTTEKTQEDVCGVDETSTAQWYNLSLWCDYPRAWQSLYKAHGAYPLPGGVIVSGFVQGYPGPDVDANQTFTAMADGTELTEGQNITVDLLPHEVLFMPFQRKIDIRVMRRFNIGNTQIAPVLDIFNLLNVNTVTSENQTFGSEWQRIRNIMQARYMRVGLELEW